MDEVFDNVKVLGSLYIATGDGLAEIAAYRIGAGPNGNPAIVFTSADGDVYTMYTSNGSWSVSVQNDVKLNVVKGEGIAMVNENYSGVLFDKDTGFLKKGSYNGTVWFEEIWTDFVLENDWTNPGGKYDNASYRKMPDGTVLLRGALSPGATASGTTIFTLPSGYRPLKNQIFSVIADCGGVHARIEIGSNGSVKLFDAEATTGLRIHGIRFSLL